MLSPEIAMAKGTEAFKGHRSYVEIFLRSSLSSSF